MEDTGMGRHHLVASNRNPLRKREWKAIYFRGLWWYFEEGITPGTGKLWDAYLSLSLFVSASLFLSASLCLSPSPISHSIGCNLHLFQNVVSTLVYMAFQVLHLWLNNYSVGVWIQLPVKETLECLPFIRCSSVGWGKGPMAPDVFNRTLGMDLGR